MKNKSLKEEINTELSKEIMKTFTHYKSPKEKPVRTTFTLTQEGDEALKYIVKAWESKIKSVIDKLCKMILESLGDSRGSVFDMIIATVSDKEHHAKHEIRKTVVLNEKSLTALNELAKKHSISRDMILDMSFQFIALFIKNSTKTTLKNHKELLSMINKLWVDAQEIETKAQKILDKEDPLLERISSIIVMIMNLSQALENEQKNGTPINSYDL